MMELIKVANGLHRIVIFNVKYSSNLGDGLIALCLESAIRTALPGAAVDSQDLAGRTKFGRL
jgi:hypothetical protein